MCTGAALSRGSTPAASAHDLLRCPPDHTRPPLLRSVEAVRGKLHVRRNCGGSALRRVADGDAVSAAWLPGAAGRPGEIPERYHLHPLDLAAGACLKRWGLLDRVLAT